MQYLHSLRIIHSHLKPVGVLRWLFFSSPLRLSHRRTFSYTVIVTLVSLTMGSPFNLISRRVGFFIPTTTSNTWRRSCWTPPFSVLKRDHPRRRAIFSHSRWLLIRQATISLSANRDETRNLGAHRATTLPRSQTLDHRQHCYWGTTTPPPGFRWVAFGQRVELDFQMLVHFLGRSTLW